MLFSIGPAGAGASRIPRGMSVTVTLGDSHDNDASQLQEVFNGYLFQATVKN